jgi:hypothetical protein
MNRTAHVSSIDAIRQLRIELLKFAEKSREAHELLQLEARRGLDWVEQDRRRYWPEQTRKASEALIAARNELERCELRYGSEDSPSCYEQRQAVERAKRRLRLCEEKTHAVKRWIIKVHQEVQVFDSQLNRLTEILDSALPQAVARLDKMLAALDRYSLGTVVSGSGVQASQAHRSQPLGKESELPSESTPPPLRGQPAPATPLSTHSGPSGTSSRSGTEATFSPPIESLPDGPAES